MSLNLRFHHNRRVGFIAVLALLLAVATVGGGASSAPAASNPKLPLLFQGNGYRIKPGLMWGWDPERTGQPTGFLGRVSAGDPRGTAVRWHFWRKDRAVGVALARSSGCGTGGRPGKCELGYPWNGAKLKVLAWRPKNGHFTRMRMTTQVPRSSSRYYKLVLAFKSSVAPVRPISWKTVRTIRG